MYRHLLVPIDDSDLSIEAVGRAAEFARTFGARITFFHAQPDLSAMLPVEVPRIASPVDYAYAFEGRTREILAKAVAAARALGVPCDARSTPSNKPYEAIIAAAREVACDVIFMASRGRRGLNAMVGSQTLKVLAHAGLPVHVCSASPPAVAAAAMGLIRDEHRSISAVLHAWMRLLAAARRANAEPDIDVMRMMARYLREFPVAVHHPREEEYLFDRLRTLTIEVDAELDELERQHDRDREWVGELGILVESLAAGRGGREELEHSLGRYAQFVWEHLGREEGVILPAAERHFTLEDWAALAAAFSKRHGARSSED
jgi:nucleotide-binding universal stress UspA family protein/hemerythrin-like domain-containing protein